jgi:hypothetical protein
MEALFADLRRAVALEEDGGEDVDRIVQLVSARLTDSACWRDAVAGMASQVAILARFVSVRFSWAAKQPFTP